MSAVSLADKVAERFSHAEISARLKSVRLELVINARAPDKLQIAAGLLATGVRPHDLSLRLMPVLQREQRPA